MDTMTSECLIVWAAAAALIIVALVVMALWPRRATRGGAQAPRELAQREKQVPGGDA